MAYDIGSTVDVSGWGIARTTSLGTIYVTSPSVAGSDGTTVDPSPVTGGPGAFRQSVGYLWPRGDGTPSAT